MIYLAQQVSPFFLLGLINCTIDKKPKCFFVYAVYWSKAWVV